MLILFRKGTVSTLTRLVLIELCSNFFGCKSTNSGRKIMLFLFLPPITEIRCTKHWHPLYNLFSRRRISYLKKKNPTHNVYPCKPQLNYIIVEFEGWGEGLDNIRRLGLRLVYIKTYLRQSGISLLTVLRFIIVVTNLGNITYWDRFWIFNTKPI